MIGGAGYSLFAWLPHSDAWVWILFLLSCLSAFTLTIGLFTRASSILLFATLVSWVIIDAATLTADSGTLRYTGGKFTQVELLGTPVTLAGLTGSRPFRLTAGRISYDGQGLLSASGDAVFASNGMEILHLDI